MRIEEMEAHMREETLPSGTKHLCEVAHRRDPPLCDRGPYPRSCTTSRLRCSSSRLNAFTAAASADARSGASTKPRTWPCLRMSETRQERSFWAALFCGRLVTLRERLHVVALGVALCRIFVENACEIFGISL